MDHVLAMIAVGLLACRAGGHWRWQLPVVFLVSMLLGGLATGFSLPGVEHGIALSVLVLGLCVAIAKVPDSRVVVSLVAVSAFFHGYAHAAEMSAGVSLSQYAAGFLLSTALLLAAGGIAGEMLEKLSRSRAVRYAGGGIVAAGLLLIVASI
jgi:urease accessory protein